MGATKSALAKVCEEPHILVSTYVFHYKYIKQQRAYDISYSTILFHHIACILSLFSSVLILPLLGRVSNTMPNLFLLSPTSLPTLHFSAFPSSSYLVCIMKELATPLHHSTNIWLFQILFYNRPSHAIHTPSQGY